MKKINRTLPIILLLIVSLSIMGLSGWLWYDTNVDRSGWFDRNGVPYYRDFHGEPVSGWLEWEGQSYYLDETGVPATGWTTLSGDRYYFSETGTMATFWQTLSGDTYYFGPDGILRTGWQDIDGSRYYLPQGIRATGWLEVDGRLRYFGEDGAIRSGFVKVDGQVYYFQEDGTYLTGEQDIEGFRYYFYDSGILHTGWLDTDQGRRYYYADGSLALGWQEIAGKRYYLGEDGYALTGWYQEGEYSYFFLEDGAAAVGPTSIDGQTHYFTPKGIEVILVNRDNYVPSYYTLDLVTVTEWHKVDSRCYDALMQMLADCNAAGIEYVFNSGYRTIKMQTTILDSRTQEYMEEYELDYEAARAKALQSVAVPGTSEHHLGLAVDLLGAEATTWLAENCWDYGFILRYTAEKEAITGIIDEPWHFRYVGTEVSLDMKDSGLCLEEYLGAA